MVKLVWHVILTHLLRLLIGLKLPCQPPPTGSLLVLAPHPDDEILGVGGCILSALRKRQVVHIVYLSDGEAACPQYPADRVKTERAKLTGEVMQKLSIPQQHHHYLHLPDGGVPRLHQHHFAEAVVQLCKLVDQLKPDNLLATSRLDFWPYDHVACAELAEAALTMACHKPALYEYWVWAWYNLRPWQLSRSWSSGQFTVDIRPWAAEKRKLAHVYLDATSPVGKPWSGVLPWPLRKAFTFNIEVLEKKQ